MKDIAVFVRSIPAGLGMKAVSAACVLIATPERDLGPAQCMPHFGTNCPCQLAMLLNDREPA